MKRVLVTGPDGFVGNVLCAALRNKGFSVRGAQLRAVPLPVGCESVVVGDIGCQTDWSAALKETDTVVHLAARVHIMREAVADPLSAYQSVNVYGTRRLAEAAFKAGVRRFIFMSTIKVNGENSNGRRVTAGGNLKEEARECESIKDNGSINVCKSNNTKGQQTSESIPFSEKDPVSPVDAYAISKWQAECVLREVAGNMETVVIRAPLIYGPGVKGNMEMLMKLAASGFPLPLGAVQNQRSLLYVGNLADFIIHCIEHPAAANETFLVSDNHDLSTNELVRMIRQRMGKSPRLIPVPEGWFKLAGKLTGRKAVVDRLLGSLQVDCSKAFRLTGWIPPISIETGVKEMVNAFCSKK